MSHGVLLLPQSMFQLVSKGDIARRVQVLHLLVFGRYCGIIIVRKKQLCLGIVKLMVNIIAHISMCHKDKLNPRAQINSVAFP